MSDEKVIQKILREETERRLSIMSDPAYRFPEALPAIDKAGILLGIASSLLMLAACMMGWLGE